MSHVLSHVAVLALLAVAVYLPGRALERLLPVGELRPVARRLFGLAWWSVGLFVPASIGAYSLAGLGAWAVLSAVLVGVAASRGRRARPGPSGSSPSGSTPSGSTRRIREALPVMVALVAVVPLLLVALGPTRSWDAEVYHLSLPQLYVEHGGFRDVEMSVYSHWPLGTELFFGAALLVQDYMTAKTVHLGFGLLVLLTLVDALRDRRSRPGDSGAVGPAVAAILLFLANDVVLFEMRVAYVDLATAFYALATFLFLSRAAHARDRASASRLLLAAGVGAGLLAGTKITGVALAALLSAVYLPRILAEVSLYGVRLGLGPWLRRFVAPLVVGWLPWVAKTAAFTGNPVYPAFWTALGGPDWSPRLAEQFAAWQQSIGMGRGALDYLLLLPRVILFGDHGYGTFDGRIGPFWIVVLPLVVWAALRSRGQAAHSHPGRRIAEARRALGAAGLLFVLWAASSQQTRFLIPVLALVCLAAGHVLARARPAIRIAAPVLGILMLLAVTDYPRLARTAHRHVQIFSTPGFDPARVEPAVASAVRSLPETAKLLLLHTNHRFALDREVLADSFFEASQIVDWLLTAADPDEVAERLRERGVTHVLIELRPRLAYPPPLVELVQDPRRVEPVHRDDRHLLLALR